MARTALHEFDESEVLQRRAEQLARPRADDAVQAELDAQLAVAEFRMGDERYAVRLSELRAALPLARVTPVPLAPAHLIGILRYEGAVIPALSLAALLGIRGWQVDPAVLLVVDAGKRRVAFDSEVIPKPSLLARSAVQRACESAAGGPALEVMTGGGGWLQLLDLERLLAGAGTR